MLLLKMCLLLRIVMLTLKDYRNGEEERCVCMRERKKEKLFIFTLIIIFLKENLFVFWNKKHIFRSETVFLCSMRFFNDC